MRCSRCQQENPAGVKFCGGCGAKLEARCSQCGRATMIRRAAALILTLGLVAAPLAAEAQEARGHRIGFPAGSSLEFRQFSFPNQS